MTKGSQIAEEDLPPTLNTFQDEGWIRIPLGSTMEDSERIIIRDTLSYLKGNKTKTADILDIGRKTLHRKLAELNLEEAEQND
jgi:DNA-binding NtrC family response regulator